VCLEPFRNKNTRAAYAEAVGQFLAWDERGSLKREHDFAGAKQR
jgi:hypothetical protein